MRQKCSLILSNGDEFQGELIGAPVESNGEMVFTTGMVGYTEALTDPSYFGQILLFSYPLIGNYGVPDIPQVLQTPIPSGFESSKVHASAVILTIDSAETFHWRSLNTLDKWLEKQQVPGVVGVDTRHLVHTIRKNPGITGKIVPSKPVGHRKLTGFDLSEAQYKDFVPGQYNILNSVSTNERMKLGSGKFRIAVMDFGVKWNILRQLMEFGCEVEVVPWNTKIEDVDCNGWLLSNGPGDPAKTDGVVSEVAKLIQGDRPVLGICLGHQILCLAAGCETEKMMYGHRSHNQPVYTVGTRKGFITSQNHGYIVKESPFPQEWTPWFRNINDQTIEGIRHKNKPFMSVQFHPESAGGPRDTSWILENFVTEVKNRCL